MCAKVWGNLKADCHRGMGGRVNIYEGYKNPLFKQNDGLEFENISLVEHGVERRKKCYHGNPSVRKSWEI